MRALELPAFGKPDQAPGLIDHHHTTLSTGQVLVAMEAAPINPSDLLLIRGRYGHRPALPALLGTEGVGRVVEVGPGVNSVRLGERVLIMPSLKYGTWADQVVVAERDAIPVDPAADVLQIAMLGVNAVTAELLLSSIVDLAPGSWVAQNAANSAVGRYVVALAKLAGLRTLSVVRRQSAAEDLTAAGADVVVVEGDDLDEQIAATLDGMRIALLLDAVGGESCGRLMPWLEESATVVNYGGLSGQPVTATPADLVFRDIRVRGFWQKRWVDTAPREEIAQTLARLGAHVATGILSAAVEATYPLERHAEALAHASRQERRGKVLFVW